MGDVYKVQVRYEWDREYKVFAASEGDAETMAIEQAKEDISDEIGDTPPSASEFETYVL